MASGPFTISSDPKLVGSHFDNWRRALLQTAVREPKLWRLAEERFFFRNQYEPKNTDLGRRVALGVDPLGDVWAVQINEAEEPGDPNVLSAIALDPQGRPFLLRQGRLNPNSQSKDHILNAEFA